MDQATGAKLIIATSGRVLHSLRTLALASKQENLVRARELAEAAIDLLAEAIEEVNNAFPKV